MMERRSFFILVLILQMITLVAMEEEKEKIYPWYQSYKNPAIGTVIAQKWQKTKDLVKKNKRTIALILFAAGSAYVGLKLISSPQYNKIARAFSAEGLDISQIQKFYGAVYTADLLRLGATAYTLRFSPSNIKDRFMNESVLSSFIYKKLGREESLEIAPEYEMRLRGDFQGELPQQSGAQIRLQNALQRIMKP